ncbi:MAG: molybdopterin converting factor subunit 1 [Pseudomonadales bacterium]|jgi:molybdopterin synthase sulfur carrier subunit|nr:molybdopterin converting factor subunit 1 [Pseudomonadales bacterium]
MLRVLFFASIRERLGRRELALAFEAPCATIAGLVARLEREVPGCGPLLLADKTIVAVNREVVTRAQVLRDGDEIAFYPPVTGG